MSSLKTLPAQASYGLVAYMRLWGNPQQWQQIQDAMDKLSSDKRKWHVCCKLIDYLLTDQFYGMVKYCRYDSENDDRPVIWKVAKIYKNINHAFEDSQSVKDEPDADYNEAGKATAELLQSYLRPTLHPFLGCSVSSSSFDSVRVAMFAAEGKLVDAVEAATFVVMSHASRHDVPYTSPIEAANKFHAALAEMLIKTIEKAAAKSTAKPAATGG